MDATVSDSKEHGNLFDVIDQLRSQGISQYVDLPEIVVCGDQSSGKSSVLEAISNMSFPTKDNLCTRFPTELILRRAPHSEQSCSVSIIPNSPETGQTAPKEFARKIDVESLDLGSIVEEAKTMMGISDAKRFSNDVLRVELSGPTQPHLTMIDLPGLFSAESKGQSAEDSKIVDAMVRGYARRTRSIILAVVSARNDFVNQLVTKLTREVDPNGDRTMGLITKPDDLDRGSDSEAFYLDLASNNNVIFRHGWHILRNRSYAERDHTPAQRDRTELDFFSKPPWSSLNKHQLGVATLRPNLTKLLQGQIMMQLPSFIDEVTLGISDADARLQRLGPPRDTISLKRRYLATVSRRFTELITAAVDGTYTHDFFGDPFAPEGVHRRLRATVQNCLDEFSEKIRDRGQSRRIIDTNDHFEDDSGKISRKDYVDEVDELIRRSRGRELPGTFNPLIIGTLFVRQSRPWKKLSDDCLDDIVKATETMVEHAIGQVTAPETRNAILQKASDGIASAKKLLHSKTEEILDQFHSIHPITYNHSFTTTFQKIQDERQRHDLSLRRGQGLGYSNGGFIQNQTTVMSSSSIAIDYAEAYYQVCVHLQ